MMVNDAIVKLIDTLGADININIKRHPSRSMKQLVKMRTLAEVEIEEAIELSGLAIDDSYGEEWVPSGPAQVTVLWDRYTPWSGGHRQFLRRCLMGAGVHDDQVAHLWAWPFAQLHPPLDSQVAFMRPLIMKALAASGSRYVLVVGAVASRMWRSELKISQVAGNTFVWDRQYVIMPVINPITVMRDPMLQGGWRETIYKFAEIVVNQQELDRMMTRCVEPKCGVDVMMYDGDGVGWCKKHAGVGASRKITASGKLLKQVNMEWQGKLL